ncbi:hypothetical protein Desca_0032 [Calderihabitans maritimus]|uniref:ATP synthase n=1 Tax=Calderihabitans maritimus TaxID=1246530 RepID=A0A1Z5HVQ5_9FIRM|nr:hypothetical protein Desca_0032 [Calderihabitans maritimus]
MRKIKPDQSRIVEAYIGEYASGKSENAVNRAVELVREGRRVTLVDVDIVEPFYTLRPIKKKLIDMGIDVITWETRETMGLGEAGSGIKPEGRWALWREGDVILDVGYGVAGAKTLNLIEGAMESKELKVLVVVNIARPLTSTVEDIVQYVKDLGRADGLINNSHLGEETTLEFVQDGARIVTEAAKILNLPVVATAVEETLAPLIGSSDCMGNPVRRLHRYMPQTFW